ncbi:MAG: UDP-2,3-diacylglucosamine diphosphatase [Candidatus Tenebribacter burtonii]|nr:UDP-2,3-diacylglucosamine diphosphatase [Candidatus Tenebribacter burtonii]
MNVYIASDFHLKFEENAEDKERRNKVINFLDSIKDDADLLILNGDIFDLWFVWEKFIIKGYFPLLVKLHELRERGVRILFIAGNHDFWFKNFLTDTIGIEVFKNDFCETIDGVNIFVSHGDRYTSNDLRYQVFRRMIRNKFFMWIFGNLHPDIALSIGKKMSRSSRKQQTADDTLNKREKGLIQFAKKKLKETDLVILGHSHIPKIERYDNGIYANAGDWINNDSYLTMKNGKIKLHKYKKESD